MVSFWRSSVRFASLLGALCAVACKPEFSERTSEVLARRVLSVRSDPPEADLGSSVDYHALVVNPTGPDTSAPMDWAYCTRPKPVRELNDVNSDCFVLTADYLKPFSTMGIDVSGTIPSSACRQFGPDISDIPGGQGRPTDPDGTGGFYQPARVLLANGDQYLFTLVETRIRCNLTNATLELTQEFSARYRVNTNPQIDSLSALVSGATDPVPLVSQEEAAQNQMDAPRYSLTPNSRVVLRATWAACDATPSCGNHACEALETSDNCPADCPMDGSTPGCTGPETYAYNDLVNHAIVDRRESMRVSWYATGGSFDEDRTGRAEEEAAITYTENGWNAPGQPGTVFLWVVLRDSRGGETWKSYRIEVQ
jgi:hypothetical protein